MPATPPLVSIGLPVFNGERTVAATIASALAQTYEPLEVVVSDNASTDGTQEIVRELAARDPRLRYHRQATNLGLIPNFVAVVRLARGEYHRWLGDDDRLDPGYLARCVAVMDEDPRLVLVTTQQLFRHEDGTVETAAYDGAPMRSDDPLDRFEEMLRLLTESHLLLDPLYGLHRRAAVAGIPRPNMLREDEVFAARLALAGPWAHLMEVLSERGFKPFTGMSRLAARLDVPPWHVRVSGLLQARELVRVLKAADLDGAQRRRGYAAVAKLVARRQRRTAVHRARKLSAIARGRLRRG